MVQPDVSLGINAILVKYLKELEQEARSRNLKTQFAYRKAINSLTKHSELIASGKDASRLGGIGPAIAEKLDLCIAEYKKAHNGVFPAAEDIPEQYVRETQSNGVAATTLSATSSNDPMSLNDAPMPQPKKRKPSTKAYIPLYRSGGYAILLTLHIYGNNSLYVGCMSRTELIDKSQPFSDTPMESSHQPGKHFSGWTSIKTLVNKALVSIEGHPPKYALSDQGRILAQHLYDVACLKDPVVQRLLLTDPKSPPRTPISSSTKGNLLSRIEKALFRKPTTSPRITLPSSPILMSIQGWPSSPLRQSSIPLYPSCDIIRPKTTGIHQFTNKMPGWDITQLNDAIDDQLLQHPNNHRLSTTFELSQNSADDRKYHEMAKHTEIIKNGSFDIILVIDNREVRFKADRNYMQEKLLEQGIRCVSRSMELGDFVWIAKCNHDEFHDKEIVLDDIVERKRLDDLQSSIMDGRFKEQKFRLRHCGAKRVTYLIEDYGTLEKSTLDPTAIRNALAHTQVKDEFFIKRTESIEDTLAFLTLMTHHIRDKYLKSDLVVLRERALFDYAGTMKSLKERIYHVTGICVHFPYGVFQEMSSKSKLLTVKDIFKRQLIQIKGMSAARATAIVNKYPTVKILYDAYQRCINDEKRENLLAEIPFGNAGKPVGAQLSKVVFQLFCHLNYTN